MEIQNKTCSSRDHNEIIAVSYCCNCRVFMCNKCENFHSNLFTGHEIFKLDKNINSLFTVICQESNHKQELEFFCKTHNILCCGFCITKIKTERKGQHSNCEVCLIENITIIYQIV